MASIVKRGPYQWQAKIRRKGWPKQVKTFETHEDAARWTRKIESEMDDGFFVSRKGLRKPLWMKLTCPEVGQPDTVLVR